MNKTIKYRDVRPQLDEAGLAALADEMREKRQVGLRVRKVKLAVKNLSFLASFDHLRHLAIEELTQGSEYIQQLKQLETLSLLRVKQINLSFLEGLPQLRVLGVAYCGCTAYSALGGLRQLKTLTISNTSGLRDVDFLGELESLEYLFLSEAKGFVGFPDMSRAESLRHVFLSGLPDLKTLEGLARSPQLREVFVQGMPGLEPESFAVFLKHPTLVHLRPCLDLHDGSARNTAAEQVVAERFGCNTIDRDYPPLE